MELYKYKAHELKSMIKNKEIKVEEVTQAFFNRIHKTDEKIGAYLYKAEEEAINSSKA
ncbi:MAG: Asp-tRNA(Asn)/Glu-tRNA(Gln) amidotransferase subunit GatA, partial [Bacillota bacterium]|nr:Asp-tRNA(Asn)/Glu-tRNA(Gln) amidotransferase subunit GatA [Bacillota bacterium]